eukprot:5701315-Amphidinium_carterae.1
MHSENIMNYAAHTATLNKSGLIDMERVPIWSKFLAILIYLGEHDLLFWIDADAAFLGTSRSLESMFDMDSSLDTHIWVPENWIEYPSVQREELIDTSTMLFRNSLWTRRFL